MLNSRPFALTFLVLLLTSAAPAGVGRVSAYRVEAAFLYHFAQFVTWPADTFTAPDTPFRIGVLGEDLIAPEVEDTVAGKAINGHPFRVLRLVLRDLREAGHCQILFISPSENPHLAEILSTLKGTSTLTVTREEGSTAPGVIVAFFISQQKVRFHIDDDAARAAGLKISAKLLSLARNPQHP